MIKYIIFDFDGTLADTFKVMKEVAKNELKNISNKDFELLRNKGIREMIKRKNIHIWELPKIVLRLTSKMNDKEDVKLFPGVLESLKILSKSYKLGIVSGSSEENIIQGLKKYNIQSLFDFVFPQSLIFGKDRALKKMCKKYKIDPSEAIYVGDEDRDIIAAKKIKIKSIAVTWGYNSKNRLKEVNPDFIVNSPKEIIEKIS